MGLFVLKSPTVIHEFGFGMIYFQKVPKYSAKLFLTETLADRERFNEARVAARTKVLFKRLSVSRFFSKNSFGMEDHVSIAKI